MVAAPVTSRLPAYVNDVPRLEARMRALAEQYPHLVQLHDIGDSAEKVDGRGGHDIWGLVIGRAEHGGAATPVEAHLAGLHPVEWANPHLLLAWAERALPAYGSDPATTKLLDAARAVMVPLANPDMFARSIAQPGRWLRHNARGVDLNRNFPGSWQPGSAPGPAAASEPEVQAVTRFFGAMRPAALIDWHSSQRTNLYNDLGAAGVNRAFAERIGAINGYQPRHSDQNYRTYGTGKDYGSVVLGVPSLTIETGGSFAQDKGDFEDTVKRNVPVFDFLLSIAADPLAGIGLRPVQDAVLGAIGPR